MTAVLTVARTGLNRLLNWKVRGVRWIDIIGVVVVAVLIFSVYVAKAAADREDRRIAQIEREISENRQRVRLLRAEIARLEQPGRLENLSRSVGLEPVDVHRRATEADLPGLKSASQAPQAAPVVATPAPVPAPGAAVSPEAPQ